MVYRKQNAAVKKERPRRTGVKRRGWGVGRCQEGDRIAVRCRGGLRVCLAAPAGFDAWEPRQEFGFYTSYTLSTITKV